MNSDLPLKSDPENSLMLFPINHENKNFLGCITASNDGSLSPNPSLEVKIEPEIFQSDDGDMKFSCNIDSEMNQEVSLTSKKEVKKEGNLIVFTGLLDESHVHFESIKNQRLKDDKEIFFANLVKKAYLQKRSQSDITINDKEKAFMSSECGKMIDLESHLKAPLFNCNSCEKIFTNESHLKRHIRIHSGEKPFRCNVCGKAFCFKFNLKSHMRIHTEEKRFRCSDCGKAFHTKSNMEKHRSIHTGDKPFKCNDCGKTFYSKYYITNHMRTHTGEKPFICSECGKAYSMKCKLTRHMRIHSEEKPIYPCSQCEKTFSQKSKLTKHVKIHTAAPSPRVILPVPHVANGDKLPLLVIRVRPVSNKMK